MISLYDLLKASSGQLLGTATAQIFDELSWDASKAGPGQLFVAAETDEPDTHRRIVQAINGGVSGVLCTEVPNCEIDDVSVVLVDDTLDALLAWSHYVIGKQGVKVIGVSGSVGKSFTIDAILRVLSSRYNVLAADADISGPLSIPHTLSKLRSQHQFVVLKLDILTPGNIVRMVEAVQPEVIIVTHTDELISAQTFYDLSRCIEYLSPSDVAILNFDDERVRTFAEQARSRIISIGINTFGADVMASNVTEALQSLTCDLRLPSERYIGQEFDVIGAHHLYGIMSALAVGTVYGIPGKEALNLLREIVPLAGKMNPILSEVGWFLVDDTHSASIIRLRKLLEWAHTVRKQVGRTIMVLGDCGSATPDQLLQNLGSNVATAVDTLITLGPQAASLAQVARRAGLDTNEIYTLYSPRDVIATIRRNIDLNSKDLVLVAGYDRNRRSSCEAPMKFVVNTLVGPETDERPEPEPKYITMPDQSRLSWLELDYQTMAENVRKIKQFVGNNVGIMAIVKADGYGHGAIACANTALANGASWLGVSSVYDALMLRESGLSAPILAMNYLPLADVRTAIENDITVTVYDLALAKAYNRTARQLNHPLNVHIKIDSGMGRMGVMANDVVELVRQIGAMDYLKIDGIFTHFSTADGESTYVDQQLAQFRDVLRKIQTMLGMRIRPVHAANTAATLRHPETHFDMVRVGLGLYGLAPENIELIEGIKPVLSWKTTVAQVKMLPANHPVGYGNTYVTDSPERVAVLPIGYGDGLRRAPQRWGEVLIHGIRAPIRGRISMEKTVVSIQNIPDVAIGDEVVLLGEQNGEQITAEEIANWLGTINYEVTSTILPRTERHASRY